MSLQNSVTRQEGILLESLPIEMCFKILTFLDFKSILQMRLVSKHWKLIAQACRDHQFVCNLEDSTLTTAINSGERMTTLKIRNFSGAGNKVVSSTRGSGRLFANTECIRLIGPDIVATELNKMINYAVHTVKELVFRYCLPTLPLTVFKQSRKFTCLNKLMFYYKGFPRKCHTLVLHRLAAPKSRGYLPALEHFKIEFKLDSISQLDEGLTPGGLEVFENYLAIAKVVSNYSETLKTVEIERTHLLVAFLDMQVDINVTRDNLNTELLNEIQFCLNQFEKLNLNKLHITPLVDDEGNFPWILETSLLQRQPNLEEVQLDRKHCIPPADSQDFARIFPQNWSSLTSVKITQACVGNRPVDLSPFVQCSNLRTLWMSIYRVRVDPFDPQLENAIRFSNLEMLPKRIKSLHFKNNKQDRLRLHQQLILNRQQLRYIINNMRELESLWMHLVIEESLPFLLPQLNPRYQQVNVYGNVNIETFQELLAMPKLKELKFHMLRAAQIPRLLNLIASGYIRLDPVDILTLRQAEPYIRFCSEAPNITCITKSRSYFSFGYFKFTISIKPTTALPHT